MAPKGIARRRPADKRAAPPATSLPTPDPSQSNEPEVGAGASQTAGSPQRNQERPSDTSRELRTAPSNTDANDVQPGREDNQANESTTAAEVAENRPEDAVDQQPSRPLSSPTLDRPGTVAGSKRKRGQGDTEAEFQDANTISQERQSVDTVVPDVHEGRSSLSTSEPNRGANTEEVVEPRLQDDANGALAPATENYVQSHETSEAPNTRVTRRKKAAGNEAPTSADSNLVTAASGASKPAKPRQPRKPRKSKKESTSAPGSTEVEQGQGTTGDDVQDPELVEIDATKTTMSELVRDHGTGKTSEREKKMQGIDWVEVARKRREDVPQAEVNQDGEGGGESESNQPETPRRPQQGMQLRMVNGQIVLDEASQHIDRQAQALLDAENMVVDENADLTRRVNRMTWINDKRRDPAERVSVYKAKTDPWTDEETDRFYEALRMFGTDFFIISKMFAPRTRRQIKLKFVREERLDPTRINMALSGAQTVPMDLQHYAAATGLEEATFKDPEQVNAELKLQEEANTKEVDRKREEANEAQKQRDIMNEQRDREKEGRDRERAVEKERRDQARRMKRSGRGLAGSGTF